MSGLARWIQGGDRLRQRKAAAALVVAVSVLLSACQPGGAGPETPAPAKPVALGPFAPPLTIGPNGAFQLTSATAFQVDALAPHFPGLVLTAGEVLIDRRRVRVIQARTDGMVVYDIYPGAGGKVGSVVTRSAAVAGPQQDVIGSTRMRDLPPEELAICTQDRSTGEERQICSATPNAPFERVFRPDSDFRLSLTEARARLESVAGGDVLVEMRWRPAS